MHYAKESEAWSMESTFRSRTMPNYRTVSTFQMFDRNGITFVFTADDHDGKVDDEVSVPKLLRAIMEEHCK